MSAAFLEAILRSLTSFTFSPDFWVHAGISFSRVLMGIALGIAYALMLIAVGQTAKPVSTGIAALNSGIRYAPPTAFIGIIIFWFGLGGQAAVALICLGTAPYILLMFLDTLAQRPSAYDDFVRLYRVNPLQALLQIHIPYALPGWIRAVRVNIGAAWTFLVVAEMIGAQSGVGYLMAVSQRFLKAADMIALILIVGVIGLVTDLLLARLQARISPWQGKYYG
jgi:NitT/TauT family transport system permease protein